MKVAELAKQHARSPLPPLAAKVLEYLDKHSDEVFPYRDEGLIHALGIKASALSWTLWWLHQNELIDKEEVGGKVYFGSRRAITDLRGRLGLTKLNPFERARANAERIRARIGNINTLELLDAVRGPWD